MTLRWTFDGDGEWEASSSMRDGGNPFVWRIGVCDDGTFAVSESDSELTNCKETFCSLDAAKAFCQYEENASICTGEPLPNPVPEPPRYFPLPWSVRYFKRCEEWHDKSCPHVVDGCGKTVLEVARTVGHPGEYDFIADRTCNEIVSAVNATAVPV